MIRRTRYQGAIVENDKILLIRHTEHASGRSFWVIPGGGHEAQESEIACVTREMREETNLEVTVDRLLFEYHIPDDDTYATRKTYLCRVQSGQASPGYEPEEDASAVYAITEVAWFDLSSEEGWEEILFDNQILSRIMHDIRRELGYL